MWDEAGESILYLIQRDQSIGNVEIKALYSKASDLFKKTNNIDKIVYCFEQIKEYQEILIVLFDNEKRIVGIETYVKKYLALFFKEEIMTHFPGIIKEIKLILIHS